MTEKKPIVRSYFKCGVCYSGAKADEWCEHFMQCHLKDYEESFTCKAKNCNARNILLADAVVHYKKAHLKYFSTCWRCSRKFRSIEEGRIHNIDGCGEFIFCNWCVTFIYGERKVEKHKNKGCREAPDGNGEHCPDHEEELEYELDVERQMKKYRIMNCQKLSKINK